MCITIRRTERQISELTSDNKRVLDKIDVTLRATTETMENITEFKKNTDNSDKIMREI